MWQAVVYGMKRGNREFAAHGAGQQHSVTGYNNVIIIVTNLNPVDTNPCNAQLLQCCWKVTKYITVLEDNFDVL